MAEPSLDERLATLEALLGERAQLGDSAVAEELRLLRREVELIAGEYRILYRSLPAMIHSIDGEGRLLSVSDVWLKTFGRERQEVIGRPITDFLAPDSARKARDVVMPAFLRTGHCEHIEYQFLTAAGEPVDVLLSATAEYDGRGRFVRSLAVLLDISERKRMEKRLQESNRRLGEANADLERFAFVASHDLQEPLRKIEVACSLLREDYGTALDEDALGLMDIAQGGAGRMRQMIRDLLDFSRLKGDLEKAPVDLREVFEGVRGDLREAIEESGARLAFEGDDCRVQGDGPMLGQVLQNLLSNAIRYRGEAAPDIRVRCRKAGEGEEAGWLVSVTDNGIGIPPAYAERIFEIFQRLQPREAKGGNGIGLALCRRIVERHGGAIWLDKDFEGGSRFCFTLPAA